MEALEQRVMLTGNPGDFDAKFRPLDAAAYDYFGDSVAISGNIAIVGASGDNELGSDSGAAYLFDVRTGQQIAKLTAADGAADDYFGCSVAISGNIAIVGAYGDDVGGSGSGSAYLFDVTTGQQIAKLIASDGAADDWFGYSVAISGNTAIVGAYRDDNNVQEDSGSAYLFDVTSGQQFWKLTALDGASGDHYGISVAISGYVAIIGAEGHDDHGTDSGAAYVFSLIGGLTGRITASDGAANDFFGNSVAISGNIAIIGALGDDYNGTSSGSAYLFDVTTGQQVEKLTAQDGAPDDSFGYSVAINGNTAIVGALYDGDAGPMSGSAYLFNVATGQQIAKLTPSDALGFETFGNSVGISGTTVIVGARLDANPVTDSGSAYVWGTRQVWVDFAPSATGLPVSILLGQNGQPIGQTRLANEGWTADIRVSRSGATDFPLRVYLTVSPEGDATVADDVDSPALANGYVDIPLGQSSVIVPVLLRTTGEIENQFRNERLIVTPDTDPFTPGQQGNPTGDPGGVMGQAFPYSVRSDSWTVLLEIAEVANLGAPWTAYDGAAGDFFGSSVAISGNIAIVGAYGDDDHGSDSGSAYLFNITTGQQVWKLMALDGAAGDFFGNSVAISGNIAIVGAYGDDDRGSGSGSAYLFDVSTGQQIRRLTAADGAELDLFGYSVAISGNIAIVGSWGDDDHGSQSGSAYLFDVTTGQQIAKLAASDSAANDLFGYSAAISGNIAIVGAVGDDDHGSLSGSAYVFDVTTGQQIAKLTASDGAANDNFGESLAISGNVAVVGASFDDDRGTNSGSAYLFDVTTGQQISKLTASDGAANNRFGSSVAISGNTAIVGADQDDERGPGSGSAYLFDVSTGRQIGKLTESFAANSANFGRSVAISGNIAIAGALGDDAHGTASGSVYVFGPRSVSVDLVDVNGQPVGTSLYDGSNLQIGVSQVVNEGQVARLRFNRTGMLDRSLRVYFNISGEAAPDDFQGGSLYSGFVDIPQGQTFVVIEISLNADGRPDDENQFRNERLIITLDTDQYAPGQQGNPTGDLVRDEFGRWIPHPGGAGAEFMYSVVPDRWTAVIEIVDIDAKYVKIESSDATGGELSGDSVDFTLTRGGDLSQPLTMDIDVSGTATGGLTAGPGIDYTFAMFGGGSFVLANGLMSVTFPAGRREVILTAIPRNDNEPEGIEWIHLELLERAEYTLTTDPVRRQARVGFIDDDMPSVMLRTVGSGEIVEGGSQQLHFQVVRGSLAYTNSPLVANVIFQGLGTTASPADYRVRLGSPTGQVLSVTTGGFYQIAMAGGQSLVDIYVEAINDTVPERDERILARLISGSTYINHPTLNRVELIIREDSVDRSIVTIEASDPTASETNRATGEFLIRRIGGSLSQALEVRLAMGGTARWDIDFVSEIIDEWVPNAVTFPPGVSEIRLTVLPNQDTLVESMEVATLRLLQTGAYLINVGVNDLASVSISDLVAGIGTQAIWDWSMPDRYGIDANGDGRIDLRNTPEYANPADGFPVRFDGAASSSGSGALSYSWTILNQFGALLYTATQAIFLHSLPEAIYMVTLHVADAMGSFSEHTDIVEVDDILIVSAGDSVASGEGNPVIRRSNDPDDILDFAPLGYWADDGNSSTFDPNQLGEGSVEYDHAAAHRSTLASSSLTAMEIERRDPKSSVTFVFVAQTGAEVTNGFAQPKDSGDDHRYPNHFPRSQAQQIKDIIGNRKIDAMLMSLGANDMGFSDILGEYVFRFEYEYGWFFSDVTKSLDEIRDTINQGLSRLPGRYSLLNQTLETVLHDNLPPRPNIFLQGYFDPTGGSNGQPADVLQDITAGDIGTFIDIAHTVWRFINYVGLLGLGPTISDLPLRVDSEEAAHGRQYAVIPLNAAVQSAADTYGWTYLQAPNGFSTRGYSASNSWIRTAVQSRIYQGGGLLKPSGAAHPNESGHQAYSISQLATFLGDARKSVFLPGEVISVVEGGATTIAASVDAIGGGQSVGGVTYEWDLDFDGRSFDPTPYATGNSVTFSAAELAFPATRKVAVRVTDQLGRSSFDVADIDVVNGTSGRLVYDVSSVNATEPFWLVLQRAREQFDRVDHWRVEWGDGYSERIPADWLGRSHVYQNPGLYTYSVWLTDAGGEIPVQGGTVSVVADDPFPRVGVTSLLPAGSEQSGAPLRFLFTRSGQLQLPLSIFTSVGNGPGLATNGVDYVGPTGEPLPLSVFFPAGTSSVIIEAFPVADANEAEGAESVEVSINPSSLYSITTGSAVGSIADGPSTARGDIAGMVYDDDNGNGLFDSGETPLTGRQVGLDLDGNGVIGQGEPVAVTGPDGRYTLPDRVAGIYRLLLIPQGGWVATGPEQRNVTVVATQTTNGQDFSVAHPVIVRGSVFSDDDIDGEHDVGEVGRSGIVVWIDRNANGALDIGEPSTLSGPTGSYEIAGAPPGELLIRAMTDSQWTNTNGTAGGAVGVMLRGGQTAEGIDLGQRRVLPRIFELQGSRGGAFGDYRYNQQLTLTAWFVDPWTSQVHFFRESNGQIGLQTGPGGDAEIGVDPIASDGWSLSFRLGLTGTRTFYAAADDGDGELGPAVGVSLSISGFPPAQSEVGIRPINTTVREGGRLAAVFEVFRTGPNADALTVNLASPGGPGLTTNGVDHPSIPTTIVLPAGQDTARIYVPIPDDDLSESEEQLRVEVVAGSGYSLSSQFGAQVGVRDASSTPPVASVLGSRTTYVGIYFVAEVAFSEEVGASLTAADVRLQNLTTGTDIPAEDIVINYDPTSGVARFGRTGHLPVGQYRLTLTGAGISDPRGLGLDGDGNGVAGGDFVYDFTVWQITDQVWDGGGGDGLWQNPLNWSDEEIPPGANDNVAIPAGAVVRTVDMAAVHSLHLVGTLVLNRISTLYVGNSLVIDGSASLRVEIAGPSQFGRIQATGAAHLDGHVEAALVGAFTPASPVSFNFIQSGSVTGEFSSSQIFAVASNLKTPLVYDATGVRLLVTSIADWNNDLTVNVPDIFAFLSAWFAGEGDFDGDGSNSVPDIFAYLSAWFSAN